MTQKLIVVWLAVAPDREYLEKEFKEGWRVISITPLTPSSNDSSSKVAMAVLLEKP